MVTVDGSELARAIVDQVRTLAEGSGSEVIVLEAIPTGGALRGRLLGEAYEFTGGRPEAVNELAQSQHLVQREEAQAEVDRAGGEFAACGPRSTDQRGGGNSRGRDPRRGHRYDVDANVMATRGHGGHGREVVGSVAGYVLRHAHGRSVILAGPRTTTREAAPVVARRLAQ
jgi:nucleotide-binding universal stress UspA family protein